jgi:hypothetical protein
MPPDDMKEDRLYSVWHCVNPTFSEERKQKRTFIGSVSATTLEEAFTFSQNDYHNWSYLTRSTSIGDVIETSTGKYFLVLADGFTLIDEDDLGNEVVDLNSFENQPTE